MRNKKSMKNFVTGLASFTITMAMGIIIPRLFLLSYGSEVNGLINSVKQIFAYFLLLEAGVGGAARQALYGPVARNDYKNVSSILSATNEFYKKIGIVYAVAVFLLAVTYPIIVETDIPKFTIICIILFQGEAGVVKYLVTGKLQLLLQVDGETYVLTIISTIFSIFSNFARIFLLYAGANILWVQGVFCIVDICQVGIIVVYAHKKYPWLNLKESPNFEVLSQRSAVLAHQVSGLIFNNTDTIILTVLCGLKSVSVYSMYAMLYGMVANIIGYISSSVSFAMGQIFNSDREKYEKIQETYETYYLALSFAFFTIAYIFILPFLKLYTSGVDDINYIDKMLPTLFLIIQMLTYGRNTSNNIIDYAGLYKETQIRSLIETGINIIVSLVCVIKLGLYGVLVGTIVALIYRTNDMILYANHVIMKRSALPTYRRWIRNILLTILCASMGNLLPKEYLNYMECIEYAVPVALIIIVVFVFVNSFWEKEARKLMWSNIMCHLPFNVCCPK